MLQRNRVPPAVTGRSGRFGPAVMFESVSAASRSARQKPSFSQEDRSAIRRTPRWRFEAAPSAGRLFPVRTPFDHEGERTETSFPASDASSGELS